MSYCCCWLVVLVLVLPLVPQWVFWVSLTTHTCVMSFLHGRETLCVTRKGEYIRHREGQLQDTPSTVLDGRLFLPAWCSWRNEQTGTGQMDGMSWVRHIISLIRAIAATINLTQSRHLWSYFTRAHVSNPASVSVQHCYVVFAGLGFNFVCRMIKQWCIHRVKL